jgi:hypothetical protein
MPEIDKTTFMCKIDKKEVYFDFSDDSQNVLPAGRPLFKFHYVSSKHSCEMDVFPFSPVSFYNWVEYSKMVFFRKYDCLTNKIMNNQVAYANAQKRRTHVQTLLKGEKDLDVDFTIYIQRIYWEKCLDSCMHVLVPGFSEAMVDRSHMQMLGLGVPFITPEISETFPYHQKLIPGDHYISCNRDYSDLIGKIKENMVKKDYLLSISHSSQKFFNDTSTSKALFEWVRVNI